MATVKNIDVTPIRVPMEQPISAPGLQINNRDYVLVRLECDDGSKGIGFTYVGTGGAQAVASAAEELLCPFVIGQDPQCVKAVWKAMYRATLIQGRAGLVMNGLSAIDIALWDRNARVANLGLCKYLGGQDKDLVPAYASGGYYADSKGPAQLAAEVKGYVDRDFNAVKIKTGALGIEEEEARLTAVRDAIGPDRILMLDMYNSWDDLGMAIRYMDMYEKFAPFWIEDPFTPDDLDNYVRLARRIRQPLATGEFHSSSFIFKHIVESGAASIIQAEAPRCGGITEWLRIASMAAPYGVNMSPCWFHDLHVHLVPSITNSLFVEYFPDLSILNFGKLIDQQLEISEGGLKLPTGPGLGFNFLDEAIREYALTT